MQRPTGKVVLAHLCLPHGIKEELEVPDHSRQGGKKVVLYQCLTGEAARHTMCSRTCIRQLLGCRCARAHGVDAWRSRELGEGMILYDQKKRPQEIGEEAAPENDDQYG